MTPPINGNNQGGEMKIHSLTPVTKECNRGATALVSLSALKRRLKTSVSDTWGN